MKIDKLRAEFKPSEMLYHDNQPSLLKRIFYHWLFRVPVPEPIRPIKFPNGIKIWGQKILKSKEIEK